MRGGADSALRAPPSETDKVYTGFPIGVQEAEKVCPKFTCRFAYSGKKFALCLQLVCRKPKKFALSLPVSLHTVAISLHFVCTWFAIGLQEAEKFTCQFAFSGKCLHWYRNVYIRGYQTAEKVYIVAEYFCISAK